MDKVTATPSEMVITTMHQFRDALSRLQVLERSDPNCSERKALEIAVSRYLARADQRPSTSAVH